MFFPFPCFQKILEKEARVGVHLKLWHPRRFTMFELAEFQHMSNNLILCGKMSMQTDSEIMFCPMCLLCLSSSGKASPNNEKRVDNHCDLEGKFLETQVRSR